MRRFQASHQRLIKKDFALRFAKIIHTSKIAQGVRLAYMRDICPGSLNRHAHFS